MLDLPDQSSHSNGSHVQSGWISSSRMKTAVPTGFSSELEKLVTVGNDDGCGWLDLKPTEQQLINSSGRCRGGSDDNRW